MKTLVIYLSRTGNTKKLGDEIAARRGADIEELKEWVDRSGKRGYLRASRDALIRATANLEPFSRDSRDYDTVIVGGPVWVQTICPPARSYTLQQRDNLKQVAVFATSGAATFAQKACRALAEASGQEPVSMLTLSEDETRENHSEKLAEFLGKLTQLRAAE